MAKNPHQQEFEVFKKYLDVVATSRKDPKTAIRIADAEMLHWYTKFHEIEADLRETIHETVRDICNVDYLGIIDIPDFTKTDNTRNITPYLENFVGLVGKVPEGITVENRKMLFFEKKKLSAETEKLAGVLERLRIHTSSWTAGTESPESILAYNDTKKMKTHSLSLIGLGVYRYELRARDLSDD